MEKRLLWKHTDTNRRSPALAAWFCLPLLLLLLLVGASALPTTAEAAEQVYVSSKGDDVSGDGTQEKPYATLVKAVTVAKDNATIYVMSDLTMNQSARFLDKNLTITSDDGGPYTLRRGESFTATNDPARKGYNGALIEVGGTEADKTGSLTLTNITLDDNGLAPKDVDGKSYYIQAASDGDGNTEFGSETISNTSIVQDAIIATYNGKGNIILGAGTTLKNYGGMSAIRMSGGTLTMKNGSKICDESSVVTDRIKGTEIANAEKGLYGPAGAIWLQGGTLEMEQGAVIDDIIGRAIYADSGTVNIGGTISDIKSDGDMWQGTGGLVVHVRNGAKCTLKEGCLITNSFLDPSLASGDIFNIVQANSSLSMEAGAKIENWTGKGNVFFVLGSKDLYKGSLSINGEIAYVNTNGNHVVQASESIVKIGANANIHHNKVSYGTIYIQGGNNVEIYGKINNNFSNDRGGAVAITNHGDSIVDMYAGAEMKENYSKETGGALLVSDGKFTMHGGDISGNYALLDGGGVFVRQGGHFVMEGGVIENNYTAETGGGIAFGSGEGYVSIKTGEITNNIMNATLSPNADEGTCSAEGGESNDLSVTKDGAKSNISTYFTITDDATVDNPNIYMEKYNLTLLDPQRGIKIGNAATACETAAQNAYVNSNLSKVKGSFWYQSANDFTLDLSGLEYDSEKELYAALVETTADGTPVNPASVQLRTVSIDGDKLSLSLPGNENGYAVVFLQEGETPASIVTVTPADITVYMGGDDGYDAVVGDSENTGTSDNSLPHPMFRINAPNGVDPKNLTFKNGKKLGA